MIDGRIRPDDDGLDAWNHLLGRMPVLLEQLLSMPAAQLEEQDELPEALGVYLYARGDQPIMVAHAANIKERVAVENRPGGCLGISPLVYLLGRPAALRAAFDVGDHDLQYQSRDKVEAKSAPELFTQAQEEAGGLSLRWLPLEDYLEGRVFAMYAELTLHARIVNPSRWV